MRLLIWLLLIYCGYKLVKGMMRKQVAAGSAAKSAPAEDETFRDPICGVFVAEDDAVIGRVEGERVYFCSMECLEKYRESLTHKQ